MDLTKIDKPFVELDDYTQGAMLLAHLRGEVIEYTTGNGWKVPLYVAWSDGAIYRVKPKPVIGEVVLHGVGPVYHSLHPVMLGQNPEYKLSVTFPTRDGQHVPGVYTSPEGLQIKIEVAE
jgi:hypothetical protein